MSMFSCNDANVLDDSIKLLRMANVCPNDYSRQHQLSIALREKKAPPIRFKITFPEPSLKQNILANKTKNAPEEAPLFHIADPISNKNIPNIYSESISKNALYIPRERVSLSDTKSNAYKNATLYNIHPNEHKYLLDS